MVIDNEILDSLTARAQGIAPAADESQLSSESG